VASTLSENAKTIQLNILREIKIQELRNKGKNIIHFGAIRNIPEPPELHHPESEKVSQHLVDSTVGKYEYQLERHQNPSSICTIHLT